jgi:hypothetical protein
MKPWLHRWNENWEQDRYHWEAGQDAAFPRDGMTIDGGGGGVGQVAAEATALAQDAKEQAMSESK